MKWTGFVLGVVLAGSSMASGGPEDRTPSDKYAEVFARKSLTGGRGFAGQLEIGAPLPTLVPLLGWGEERTGHWPFWYFYDKGPWKLTVVASADWERCNILRRIEALIVEGEGAPASGRGVKVGDSIKKVEATYGEEWEALDEPIDTRGITRTTYRMGGDPPPGKAERKAFDESVFEGHYYPQHGMLFTFEDDKVSRIIATFEYDPVALWLRDEPDPAQPWLATVKAGVDRPTWDHPDAQGDKGMLHLPPAPAVEPVTLEALRLSVPKGWTREGMTWTSPLGAERLAVEVSEGDADDESEDIEDAFDEQMDKLPRSLTVRAQRVVPKRVLEHIGADAARTQHHDARGAGIEGWPARIWVLLASRGTKRYRITVSRTAWQRYPSPDGIELARRVFTSVRLTP